MINITFILIIIETNLVLFLGFGLMVYMHEQVHVQVLNSYNISSHVEYFKYLPNIVTVADEPCPDEFCNLANNLNEVVGYQIFIPFLFLSLFFVMLIYQAESIYTQLKKLNSYIELSMEEKGEEK